MIKLIYLVEIWYLEIFKDADYRGVYQKFLTHPNPRITLKNGLIGKMLVLKKIKRDKFTFLIMLINVLYKNMLYRTPGTLIWG
jgi:hypothetical protein